MTFVAIWSWGTGQDDDVESLNCGCGTAGTCVLG